VSLCLCLSQVGVLLKWQNLGSHKQHHTIPHRVSFSDAKDLREIRLGSPPTRAPNAGGVVKIDRWYTQFDRRQFVYDTWDNGSRLGRVMVKCTLFMTHCLRLNLQLHTISLVRTCHISSFCTVAWQLARLLLTRRIARSLSNSWASCTLLFEQLAFRALTLLVGLQVGHPAWKNWVIRCWCGYLSGARCRLFASQPLIISCLI